VLREIKMSNNKIKVFTDLDAWKKAHELVLAVYKASKKFPKEELYGITSQIRRAVLSVTANIAEGFSRYHYKERLNFYYNSRGSLSEVQNFLIVARDLGYISDKVFKELFSLSESAEAILGGLIRSTRNRC